MYRLKKGVFITMVHNIEIDSNIFVVAENVFTIELTKYSAEVEERVKWRFGGKYETFVESIGFNSVQLARKWLKEYYGNATVLESTFTFLNLEHNV